MKVSEIYDKDEQLEKSLSLLEDREKAFEPACIEFAEAESNYRIEFAKRFLAAEGTEKARHSKALVDVERYLRERDRAEAVKEFTREKLRDAQAVVSARQSLLTSARKTNERL